MLPVIDSSINQRTSVCLIIVNTYPYFFILRWHLPSLTHNLKHLKLRKSSTHCSYPTIAPNAWIALFWVWSWLASIYKYLVVSLPTNLSTINYDGDMNELIEIYLWTDRTWNSSHIKRGNIHRFCTCITETAMFVPGIQDHR